MNPMIRMTLAAVSLFAGASCGGTTLDLGERASPGDAGAPKADAAAPPSGLSAFERACAAEDTAPVTFSDSADARQQLLGRWYLCPEQSAKDGLLRKDFAAIEFSPGTSCPSCYAECRIFLDQGGALVPNAEAPVPCVLTTELDRSEKVALIVDTKLECEKADCAEMSSRSRFVGVLELGPAKLILRSHGDSKYVFYTLVGVPRTAR
jgi:hypothetical protein